MSRHVARDITYAHSAETRPGRAVIRVMENATGRLRLIKRAHGYDADVAQGRDFWQVMVERYGLSLDFVEGSLDLIPRDGPLIVVANHPYGILDGLVLGHILSRHRGDFRILAHQVFRKAEDLNRVILPVDFAETREAMKVNLETRNAARSYLAEGGAIGIFPGGTVSTAQKPFGTPLDPGWRRFTARLIAKSNATVVPICFHGHNSRSFQVASHLHVTLRMALLIREFGKRTDKPVSLSVGQPILPAEWSEYAKDAKSMMDFLRDRTYALSKTPGAQSTYGFEFEDKHKA
ncbi:lysophospholipid acyltransferase family protein [uncultured Aliiroseovarius sp.]|uniref:lysophospholipid acyltransferase family protein n=1 Tax=uncultured Aliiroseovarius sp. TaxID=1658783 RepID=UPI002606FF28|nr:lysophospholipid acyltransferase family protein [uncultured Aliiroseovarius sp.]